MRAENSSTRRHSRNPLPMSRAGGADELMARHARAVAAYLMSFDWDHFLTLTAKRAMSTEAMFGALRGYHRHLTRIAQRSVQYFWAVEGDPAAGIDVHAHALVAGTRTTPIAWLRRGWKHGYTDATIYDAQRFGAAYVAKDLRLDADSYDISFDLPPRRADWQTERDATTLERLIRSRRTVV